MKVYVGPGHRRAGRSICRGNLRGALAGAARSDDLCQRWSDEEVGEGATSVKEVEKQVEREAVRQLVCMMLVWIPALKAALWH